MELDCYDSPGAHHAPPRRFIGVLFDCCGVYARIYRQPRECVYAGRCPKCLRTLTVHVRPDGSRARIFRAE